MLEATMEKKFFTFFRNPQPFLNIIVHHSRSSTTTFWQFFAICTTMEGRLYLPKIFFQLFTTSQRLSQNFSQIRTVQLATVSFTDDLVLVIKLPEVRSARLQIVTNSQVRLHRTLAHLPIQSEVVPPVQGHPAGADPRGAISCVVFTSD